MQGVHWFINGSEVSIAATPNPGYKFEGWITTGSSIKISSYTSAETEASINGPGAIIAEFTPDD